MYCLDCLKNKYGYINEYSLNEKKKRVLVSMNFSSLEEWAVKSVKYSLKYQGFVDLT